MLITVRHTTTYTYDGPMESAMQQVRLVPTSGVLQTVEDWSLTLDGGAEELAYADHFGNDVRLISLLPGAERLEISAQGTVDTHDKAGVLGFVYDTAPLWLFTKQTDLTRAGRGIQPMARKLEKSEGALDALHELSADIRDRVSYATGTTDTTTTAEQAVANGQGVCQDHSHIFIAAARQAGIPARYVSGYLKLNESVNQDASHAWAEAHVEGLGWVAFDISNGVAPDERYIRLCHGLDFRDCAPIHGMKRGRAAESMVVTVQVQQ